MANNKLQTSRILSFFAAVVVYAAFAVYLYFPHLNHFATYRGLIIPAVVVAAAGNRGSGTTQVGAPATMPGVLTVAGVDIDGLASFDASSQGITIAVAAASVRSSRCGS